MKPEDKTFKEMLDRVQKFLKEAWCIDGDCVLAGTEKIISKSGKNREAFTFKLTDSERGSFFVSLSWENS